jgi:hypothetical protein
VTSRHEELHRQVTQFHHAHPEVWTYFERFTLELIRAGRTRYGAKGVMERVRWETALGGEGFKINNNFTAFYARRFERLHPEHEGFFAKREQVSMSTRPKGEHEARACA